MVFPSTTELLGIIKQQTKYYESYYSNEGSPPPDHYSSPQANERKLPADIELARQAAREACIQLYELLSTPTDILMDVAPASTRVMAVDFIYTHRIGYDLGWGDKITYRELAEARGLDEDDVRRMLRLSMAWLLFDETDDGMVVHTAPSFALATNTGLSAWIGIMTKENWPSMLKMSEAVVKYPGSQEQMESAYAMAHHLVEPLFQTWEKDPKRIKRFTKGMEFIHATFGAQPLDVLQGYESPDNAIPTLVDIGGSKGHVSIGLAHAHPKWKFIVQDLAQTIAVGEKELPEQLKDRVHFMVHDFWMEQPVKAADVYFFRLIFHDWSDKYSIRILRNLIPALKKGAKVIICDTCLPDKNAVSPYQQRQHRGKDIIMKSFSNGKERDATDWAALFKGADSRFEFLGVRLPPGSELIWGGEEAIIEAVWSPSSEDV
ncbi:S-adenosyl-L-methionine-dependent methyltransferase [Periconia macrospinosa]|uniref:S-adenosyl-L-methionine-dependent methyltransferase n=1 Tax=Periconia macrospinosa TaxID=97972 RepID=A0A2V1EC56_9PLEO|nr:S-adenosyl-L-methionine-dependent methyltransferase [Periconia macrospinosa]